MFYDLELASCKQYLTIVLFSYLQTPWRHHQHQYIYNIHIHSSVWTKPGKKNKKLDRYRISYYVCHNSLSHLCKQDNQDWWLDEVFRCCFRIYVFAVLDDLISLLIRPSFDLINKDVQAYKVWNRSCSSTSTRKRIYNAFHHTFYLSP